MRSPFATLQSLTIPAGAAPGDPAIVIGGEPPAELVAYYAADPLTPQIVGCVLYRLSAGNYSYDVLVKDSFNTLMRRAFGSVQGGVNVFEEMTLDVNQFVGSVKFSRRTNSDVVMGMNDTAMEFTGTQSGNMAGVALRGGSGLLLDDAACPFTVDSLSAPRGLRGSGKLTAGTVAASAGAEVAIPAASWATEPEVTVDPGRLMKATLVFGGFPSAATNSMTQIVLRKGSATVVGTILSWWQAQYTTAAAANLTYQTLIGYFRNSTGSPVTTKLSVTNGRLNGAASTSFYGDANLPLTLVVEDIGLASEHPALSGVPSV